MGTRPEVEVEISAPLILRDGDALLLCSDGLTGYVPEREIEDVLRGPAEVQEIPRELVRLALDRGGKDNVTVQFVQVGRRRVSRHTRRGGGVPGSLFQAVAVFLLGAGLGAGGVLLHERREPAALPQAPPIVQDRSGEEGEAQSLRQKLFELEEEKKKVRSELEKEKNKVRSELEECRKRLPAFEHLIMQRGFEAPTPPVEGVGRGEGAYRPDIP
jgi:hypothetical protein